jgi:hypothetical protein
MRTDTGEGGCPFPRGYLYLPIDRDRRLDLVLS